MMQRYPVSIVILVLGRVSVFAYIAIRTRTHFWNSHIIAQQTGILIRPISYHLIPFIFYLQKTLENAKFIVSEFTLRLSQAIFKWLCYILFSYVMNSHKGWPGQKELIKMLSKILRKRGRLQNEYYIG